ncbi:MAG TPA: hypothetical protein DCM14_06960 [Clostridiales bacterium UBA8153]|nr:hypothetical protein [Clostridiales bacterium UBA8153]
MQYLIPYLRRFNRKERFFLVGLALGNEAFRLGDSFRQRLSDVLDLALPGDAFVAMDYHLDWLFASIYLAATSGSPGPHPRDFRLIRGTHEDIDLLVAFDAGEQSHVIMLEAKGVTSYSNRQFASKMARLAAAFETPQARRVAPYLVLVSPAQPQKLHGVGPAWVFGKDGRIPWLHLPLPADLQKVVRCTETGAPSSQGKYWTAKPEKSFPGA